MSVCWIQEGNASVFVSLPDFINENSSEVKPEAWQTPAHSLGGTKVLIASHLPVAAEFDW